uniref:Protein kinase domain-containing protein n=1 Tax=Leersia perrieri TaxID=77586 RepID=A0A0D9XV32_9ORYZ
MCLCEKTPLIHLEATYGGGEEAFLMKVVTPIYKVIEKEAERCKTMVVRQYPIQPSVYSSKHVKRQAWNRCIWEILIPMWGGVGEAAALVGGAAKLCSLINTIVGLAGKAQQNKEECGELAHRVRTIADLLPHLQDPEVMKQEETRRPLEELDETLQKALELVKSCQESSALNRLFMAGQHVEKFRNVESKIDRYLYVLHCINNIGVTRRLDRICKILIPDDTTLTSSSAESRRTHEPFTLDELKAATNKFDQNKIIGWGGRDYHRVGVYEGVLPDRREVAVKRYYDPDAYQVEEFRAAIAILSPIRHKHIIRLLGSYAVEEKRMLIYEYMKNGSLHHHLHGPSSSSPRTSPPSPVVTSWRMRIEILLGVSRALEHLHSLVPPVIHHDIKPSNILLDADWMPRLSDFGVSLTFDEANCTHENAIGTLGCTAPEHLTEGILKPSSDIYNFGVVILEVLTGKKAYFGRDGESGNHETLVSLALPKIAVRELESLLDKRPPTPATRRQYIALDLAACTAARCLQLREEDRPPISEVVADLELALELIPEELN